MNGKLVDTNILIYLSKRILEFEKVVDPEIKLYISVITYMEVLGFNFESNVEKKLVEQLCKLFPIIGINGVRNHFQFNELSLIVNILKREKKRLKVKVEKQILNT